MAIKVVINYFSGLGAPLLQPHWTHVGPDDGVLLLDGGGGGGVEVRLLKVELGGVLRRRDRRQPRRRRRRQTRLKGQIRNEVHASGL